MSQEYRALLVKAFRAGAAPAIPTETKLGLATAFGAGALIVGGAGLAAWGALRQRRRNALRKRRFMGGGGGKIVRPARTLKISGGRLFRVGDSQPFRNSLRGGSADLLAAARMRRRKK